MSFIKRLFPIALKDWCKQGLDRGLAPLGWQLAPRRDSPIPQHATDDWYPSPVDGLLTRHRPPSMDDASFQTVLQHLQRCEMYPGVDQAVRKETVLWRLAIASQIAQAAAAIDGELVEFGTFRGATAYCMLEATARAGQNKQIYLYDTFQGIPDHDVSSYERQVGLVGAHHDTSVAMVRKNLERFDDRVVIREGLIPTTLTQPGPPRIAMMHVDLNLAEPTRAALRWALPRWSPGGLCLLDDYLWQGFEDQRGVVDAFFSERGLPIIAMPSGQGLVINDRQDPSPSVIQRARG